MIGTSKLNESAIFGVGMDCANTEASVMPALIFEKCPQFLWRESLNSDVAQWIRAPDYGSGGCRFESGHPSQNNQNADVRKAGVPSSHR